MLGLFAMIAATFALDAALVAFLVWAYHSRRFAGHRISSAPPMQVTWSHRVRTMSTTGALSLAIVLGGTWMLRDVLLHERTTAPWWIVLQATAVLVLYDFIYYAAHRAMHHPELLRRVHGVHHRARNPSALESFYQHPAELAVGLAILFGATWLVGPVHRDAFALAFLVYSTVNILVHSGLEWRIGLLAPLDFLTRKHHAHHLDDPRKNFSTMTPLPDWIFGTSR